MKTKAVVIILLLLVVAVLLTKNDDRIEGSILNTINPLKQSYQNFTQSIENKSKSYIFQTETIERLSEENRVLRQRMLEQLHYLNQIKNIYDVLPNLKRFPKNSISISETISYVKLNSFSQIILTKPKNLKKENIYGLIQGTVVAGVASIKNNQLYGYLTSDDKCRFSVFIGDKKAPGIAIGMTRNKMIVKFIPKWHNVKKGDKVITSGLDKIFFSNVPVGVVTEVEVQSAYSVAYIKPYTNALSPKTFFVIKDPKVSILNDFDLNSTNLHHHTVVKIKHIKIDDINITDNNTTDNNLTKEEIKDINVSNNTTSLREYNATIPVISSIPNRIDQTQDDIVEPVELIKKEIKVKTKPPVEKIKKIYRKPPVSVDIF